MKSLTAVAVLAILAVSLSSAAVEKILDPVVDRNEGLVADPQPSEERPAPPALPEGVSLDTEGFPVDSEGKRLSEADLSPEAWNYYGSGYHRGGYGGYGGFGGGFGGYHRGGYGGYGSYGGYRGGYGGYYGRR
ncbi:unnamed protein product [Cyprideis torosa]|uniref:Uncharacterized protein n=1 Tax=Cyprideis torosa TaxID=163714 RepID=A0A7R8ZN19_9CRUS|nr:unnamed protein product [Cyprideis torosa]CAG0886856.1 unnamed protein product [Cyprideis torosa]